MLKYSNNSNKVSNSKKADKENNIPKRYKTLYNAEGKGPVHNHHNRYQTDHQIEQRAMKAYNQLNEENTQEKFGPRYLDKTPKPTNYHNERPQEHWKREK